MPPNFKIQNDGERQEREIHLGGFNSVVPAQWIESLGTRIVNIGWVATQLIRAVTTVRKSQRIHDVAVNIGADWPLS